VSSLILFIIPFGGSSASVYRICGVSAPLAAFVLPLVMFFLAPIYPAMNSAVLTATPAAEHAQMAGLIMFFSAIGGIAGKTITGQMFSAYGGEGALYLSLISIGILVISLFYFDRLVEIRFVRTSSCATTRGSSLFPQSSRAE
jgi:FHS family glucose/mannose:H+ symporter-like MFS transporter